MQDHLVACVFGGRHWKNNFYFWALGLFGLLADSSDQIKTR